MDLTAGSWFRKDTALAQKSSVVLDLLVLVGQICAQQVLLGELLARCVWNVCAVEFLALGDSA